MSEHVIMRPTWNRQQMVEVRDLCERLRQLLGDGEVLENVERLHDLMGRVLNDGPQLEHIGNASRSLKDGRWAFRNLRSPDSPDVPGPPGPPSMPVYVIRPRSAVNDG